MSTMTKDEAVLAAMEQVWKDMRDGEGQPLYDLLQLIPLKELIGYLDEAERHEKLRYN